MRRVAGLLVIGMLVAAGGAYWFTSGRHSGMAEMLRETAAKLKEVTASRDAANARISDLEKVIEEKNKTLLGYTEYKKYLTAGQKRLSGQTKLLTATVRRDESYIKYMTTSLLGIKSNGAVKVTYRAEYNFGFDLPPGAYDVRATEGGIDVIVGRPKLVSRPGISEPKYEILTDGLFTDEKLAVIQLQQDAIGRVLQQGEEMAKQPAIAALCEKRLVEHLRDFLAKQPNVKFVPQITVVYKKG